MEHYLIGFSGNSRGSFSQPVNATSNEEHSIIENDMTVDENYNQDQAEPMILEATEKECEKGGQASADLSDEKEPPYDIHESDTEFLDCGTDHLNVDEVDFLKNVVNDIQEEIDHCLTSCTPSTSDKKADFVELCCEEHSLMSTAWERTGGTAARIGLFNNFNLLTENGTQRALQVIDSHRPKVMWISFPYGAFSSIQNLNEPPWCLSGCPSGPFSCLPGASLSKAIRRSERPSKGQPVLRAAGRGAHPRICREPGRSPLKLY